MKARSMALQTQINPHFYYNTLSSIIVLAENGDSETVVKMCRNLSQIMRYITNTAETTVTLKDELDYVQKYLYCMKVRYQSSLNYSIHVDESLLSQPVPKLIIQPIVENAIRYGSNCAPPWNISITSMVTEGSWQIEVTDSGPGFTEEAKRDLKVSLIVLKYTQSNSVCFVKDGQAIGVGAGQQSRVHCTRLAGQKADNWYLRQCPKVLNLPFKDTITRAERDNAIDVYIGEEYMDVLADGAWEKTFTEKPGRCFTREEKRAWLDGLTDVTLGSDAFFPFSDNIERAHKSGVKYIAEPGGSVRDDAVIDTCNKYGMVMAFTGIRLFHH